MSLDAKWITTSLLLLSTILATARTWRVADKGLRSYFVGQFAAWLVFILPDTAGWTTKRTAFYALAFIVITLCILVGGAWHVWRESRDRALMFTMALVLPVFLVAAELSWLDEVNFPQRISIGLGAVESWLGVSALSGRRRVTRILGYLWLTQAAYQVAFTLRLFVAFDIWVRINNFVPAAIVILAFSVMALQSKAAPHSTAR